MAWKFRRWKIKWNPKRRRFLKKRRDRSKSLEASRRFRRNKSKMRMVLRKSRIKGKIQRKKNKARGMYKKLAVARKRWKNILKSDINLDNFFDVLMESEDMAPTLEMDITDLPSLADALKQFKSAVELEDEADQKEFEQFIDDALIKLDDFDDLEQLEDEEEEFLEEILSFLEEFAEEADFIAQDDE